MLAVNDKAVISEIIYLVGIPKRNFDRTHLKLEKFPSITILINIILGRLGRILLKINFRIGIHEVSENVINSNF
jgi:hypothetical protein